MYEINLFSAVHIANTVLALVITWFIWKQAQQQTLRYLLYFELGTILWSATVAFESAATTLPLKRLWTEISYLGLVSTVFFFVLFAASFSGYDALFKKKRQVALFLAIPVIALIVMRTNDYHQLFWRAIVIQPENNIAIYHHGPICIMLFAYSYFASAAAMLMLMRGSFNVSSFYIPQFLLLMGAAVIPVLASIPYTFGITPFAGFDFTPFGLSISGLRFYIGKTQFKLFELMPVAHSVIVASISEGIVVTDPESRILDVNPSFCALFDKPRNELIGKEAASIHADFSQFFHNPGLFSKESSVIRKNRIIDIEIRSSRLESKEHLELGRLFLIQDISKWKRTDTALPA